MTRLNKPRPFEIGTHKDLLNREAAYLSLTGDFESEEFITPYVLALDAPWGGGKTTFLEMWKEHLQNQGFQCVYFDAWKADFYEDALPALIAETESQLNLTPKEKLTKVGRKLMSVTKSSRFWASVLEGVAGLVPGGQMVKVSTELLKSLERHNAVQNYLDYREAVDEFKESLSEFVKSKNGESNRKSLIFFIDELDRCRPTFAVDVLEKVKHVFDAEGVVFVIGVHKAALAKTIEKVYGYDDGEIYLRKFFDDTHTLINARSIVESVISRLDISDVGQNQTKFYKEYVSDLAEMLGLSPRDEGQFTPRVLHQLRVSNIKSSNFTYPIVPYLTAIQYIDSSLYQKILGSKDDLTDFPFEEVISFSLKVIKQMDKKPAGERRVQTHAACAILSNLGYVLSDNFRVNFDKRKESNPNDLLVKTTENFNKRSFNDIREDHRIDLRDPRTAEEFLRNIILDFLLT